ncbi:putative PurR-regulated permease PerM [Haloactinospora alba]|uniref:Putative PurR-regulated permease PerM n=1 Tax=Haloactinospora alba TaxID=405555 RepID=A0A543NJ51_9ACTN|nr:putative PurR-regulated permease PerM [Haloactinospora alba]
MRVKRPSEWPLVNRWRASREKSADPPPPERSVEPEPAHHDEVGTVDALRRASDIALRLLILGVVIGLLLWGISYLRVVVVPLILAVFITALLSPPTNWLRRRGLGRGLSTALTFVGALLALGAVVTLVVQPAISGFGGLVRSVGEGLDSIRGLLAAVGLDPDLLDQTITSAEEELRSVLQERGSDIVSGVWTAGTAVLEVLVGLVLVLVLAVYFVHSGDRLMEWVRTLFPSPSRPALKAAGDLAYDVMGRYVRGVALVGLIDAVGIGVFLIFLIDPALAIPLIVLTFVGAFLPVVGAFLTGLLAALVAFVTEGWIVAVLVVAVVLVVQQLESHVFAPRVYGRALELPSPVVLLVIAVGSIIAGVLGMFLATPIAAVVAALLRNRPFATVSAGEGAAVPAAGPGAGSGRDPGAA